MKFKKWIYLSESNSLYSWLDPNGVFHPLTGVDNHGTWATKTTNLKYPKSMDKLFQDGWQRITYYGHDVYTHNPNKPPNERQFRELKKRAIDKILTRIIYDNEGTDKVIWHAEYD